VSQACAKPLTNLLRQQGKRRMYNPQLLSTMPNRLLDKPSLPCHTYTALNSKTESKMALAPHLAELSEKHRSLERQIEEELSRPGANDLEISKLKKEKLRIKDEMTKLKSQTTH
jgi:hypothetical protein